MKDKELTDKLESLGIFSTSTYDQTTDRPYYIDGGDWDAQLNRKELLRDWRVAGTLMERAAKAGRTLALSFGCEMYCATDAESATPTYGVYLERTNRLASRAMIEACVVALESGQ